MALCNQVVNNLAGTGRVANNLMSKAAIDLCS